MVTIKDVARLAGVSHTTVSLAVRNSSSITEETKQKVLKAAKQLNYHPNHLARSLVKGKTNVIGIVANFYSSTFEMEILKGVEQSIRSVENDYMINLFTTLEKNDQVLTDICLGKHADGVIVLSISPSPEVVKLYNENNCPMIVIDEIAEGTIEIDMDNFHGAYMATEHLIKSGKRNLGIVLGDGNSEKGTLGLSQRERREGFLQAIRDHGLPFNSRNEFYISDYYFEEGQVLYKKMQRYGGTIDGIFCAAGDIVASGILFEAKSNHVSVPGELAIIGYDDILSSSLLDPPLSSIRQPLFQIGKNAYARMVRLLEGKEEYKPDRIVYEPQLIARLSV
ncbi:MAG: LacI family DNA-binding transcriptional regulator [Spirochaetales bacterium]|nr:LacI family DNA-binding transcriptional regulator [Spirochaetales bacterium]